MTEDKYPVELLDVDNYTTWARRMKYLLIVKGLWSAVATTDNEDGDKNDKAMAQMGLHMKAQHLATLEGCTSAKEAWQKLESIFQAKSNARKRQLRKELSQLKMGAERLTNYVARAKEIQSQLRATGYDITDQEVTWAVLAGLPPGYDTIVTVLETSTDRDVSLDEVLPKLISAEQRLNSTEMERSHIHDTALTAKRSNKHWSNQDRTETRTCYVCGKTGHIAKNCFKRGNQKFSATIAL